MNIRCIVSESRSVSNKPEGSSLTITSDEIGILINKKEKKTSYPYRIIKGTVNESREEICFITNLLDEDAYTVAKLYR